MSYYCYIHNGVQFSVYQNDKDKERNIFMFFYDDCKYIGTVRFNVLKISNPYFVIVEDYTDSVSDEINIDFNKEVEYFFDIIYGLDR